MNVVIIGGGTAGTTAAFYLRKLDKEVNITIIEKSSFTQFSPCSLPYYVNKKIADLYIFKENDYKSNNINLMLETTISSIDKNKKKIITSLGELSYDKLVLATGSESFIPQGMSGIALKDPNDINEIVKKCTKGKNIAIVGGGYIGVELAHVLADNGCNISLYEVQESILPTLDKDMSKIVLEYLESKGISVLTNANIKQDNKKIINNGDEKEFDEIIISAGFKPNIELAKSLGLKINRGIIVDDYLKADKDIFACGDCVEIKDFITNKPSSAFFATHAVKQAEIIAENILGGKQKFGPVLNSNISCAGIYVGSAGISSKIASENGIKTITAKAKSTTKSDHHKDAKELVVKIIADDKGVLIGSQIIGFEDVAGRIDLMSLAIKNKNTIYDLAELETCYNPASSPIYNAVTTAAKMCVKRMR